MSFRQDTDPPAREPYVNVEAVADYLSVTRMSINRWIHTEGFPVHQLGPKTHRFRLSEVDAWIEDRFQFKRTDSPADGGDEDVA